MEDGSFKHLPALHGCDVPAASTSRLHLYAVGHLGMSVVTAGHVSLHKLALT